MSVAGKLTHSDYFIEFVPFIPNDDTINNSVCYSKKRWNEEKEIYLLKHLDCKYSGKEFF